ncbi:hypothetical protein NA57DRAFT_76910 [Rhizodiscina lignyota]|uniref:Uncharacterized protein n=1 Tax=Rhizodiscina lignyota TaxID=1504668 RepID=A0A9P4IF32_9PEZI|nr:hypothetical protein NA57DRAFT_76910 [Rhizodiscina lignyota]
MSEQGTIVKDVFLYDHHGSIFADGMDDPGYVMDCMAWEFLDDTTGHWHQGGVPPPHEFFNCLRYLDWVASNEANPPANIRDLPLRPMTEYSEQQKRMAANCAYGMWAEKFLASSNVPSSNIPSSFPSAPPVDEHHKRTYTARDHTEFSPLSTTFTNSSDPRDTTSPGKLDLLSRADSLVETATSGHSSPTLTWKNDSSSGAATPTHRPAHRRTLSATAPDFAPAFKLSTPPLGAAALTSHAALPKPPGQMPGTFDILARGDEFAIICIKDAPFNVSINEILTHLKLGEREGVVNYGLDNPGIHIIQDRVDSKTHEVYVEMLSLEAAQRVIRDVPKRGLKVGSTGASRKITTALCSRDQFMKAIFPRPARNHALQFRWLLDKPVISSIPNPFIGYVTNEDLYNAREWAEHPRKSKHADECPQRVYDFMITTLLKLPKDPAAYGNLKGWSFTEFIERLFTTVCAMIVVLNHYVDDPKFAERHLPFQLRHLLNFRLLKRFNQTAYDFPLFSAAQKNVILMGNF